MEANPIESNANTTEGKYAHLHEDIQGKAENAEAILDSIEKKLDNIDETISAVEAMPEGSREQYDAAFTLYDRFNAYFDNELMNRNPGDQDPNIKALLESSQSSESYPPTMENGNRSREAEYAPEVTTLMGRGEEMMQRLDDAQARVGNVLERTKQAYEKTQS